MKIGFRDFVLTNILVFDLTSNPHILFLFFKSSTIQNGTKKAFRKPEGSPNASYYPASFIESLPENWLLYKSA
jgi:hypothetical protein